MSNKSFSPTKERLIRDVCSHYWLIETPKGEMCKGICKLCGDEKEFVCSWEGIKSVNNNKKNAEKDKHIKDAELN